MWRRDSILRLAREPVSSLGGVSKQGSRQLHMSMESRQGGALDDGWEGLQLASVRLRACHHSLLPTFPAPVFRVNACSIPLLSTPSSRRESKDNCARGRSWSADGGEPCGDGWNNSKSGWHGLTCNAHGKRVVGVSTASLGVNKHYIRGNVSGWSALTEATYMCAMWAYRRLYATRAFVPVHPTKDRMCKELTFCATTCTETCAIRK